MKRPVLSEKQPQLLAPHPRPRRERPHSISGDTIAEKRRPTLLEPQQQQNEKKKESTKSGKTTTVPSSNTSQKAAPPSSDSSSQKAAPPSSVASTRKMSGAKPLNVTVDDWLQSNRSVATTPKGVVVIRGDGKDALYGGKDEKKKSVWETIFGGRGGGQEDNQDAAPRRSNPRSVVAPEEVDVVASPSRGGLSVVSSVTEGTFGTLARNVSGSLESIQTKPNVIRTPKQNLRKPSSRNKRVSTAVTPTYMLPVKSHNTTPSRRPKLNSCSSRVDQFGIKDDDDMSISSFSTATNSVDSKLFAPPAFRDQTKDSAPPKESDSGTVDKEENAKLAEKWSLLGWMGGNSSSLNPSNFGRPSLATQDTTKSSSLTENLVNAEQGAGIPSKVPSSDGFTSKLRHVVCTSSFLYAALFAGMAAGLFYGLVSNSRLSYRLSDVDIAIDWDEELNVAFIGNSYLFINDIPRIMEAISENHIHQESVIHSSGGSLGNLLLTGNGMYPRWRTGEAVIDTYVNEYGNNITIYDYGLCTVAQILGGYDDILSYGNEDGAYYNDGKNPCIRNQNYFYYIQDKLENSTFVWDYVVLVDQTKRMAVEQARQQSIYALANAYGPLIESTGAIPVIVDTHAFWSDSTNMTGLVDIPTFQALIYDGVLDYVSALAQVLPDWQSPVVAPVGLAFLVVYEENYYLWQKLFIDDDIHSSVHGSYLFACVLYATLYGHLPRRTTNSQLDSIFSHSRLLVGQDIEYPSAQEAFYYRRVAKRVALDGYIPTSMSRR